MSNSNISSGETGSYLYIIGAVSTGCSTFLGTEDHFYPVPQIEILGKIFSNEYFESCEVESQPQGTGSMKLPSFTMEVLL